MDETPNLKLPYIMAAQAQKHVTHNEAIRVLDAIVQLSVLSRSLSDPPASPTDGDRYIVASTGINAWVGKDNQIAAFQDGAWMFYAPAEGWLCWIANEDAALGFDGTSWVALVSGGGGGGGTTVFTGLTDTPANYSGASDKLAKVNSGGTALEFSDQVPLLGINATPDATNKFKVASDSVLLDHNGADHRAIINKNASGNIASFLFQDGYSGRAEIGLTGDDDFHFKVSSDGSTFYESLVLDRSTGDASFKKNVGLFGYFDVSQVAVPANPAIDTARLYAKDDGGVTKLAMRDSAGTETIFGAGGSGGGGPTGDVDGGNAASSGSETIDGGNAASN